MNIESIITAFNQLPGVLVQPQADEEHLLVQVAGRDVQARIVRRTSGYPRDVREAVWQAQQKLAARSVVGRVV